MTTEPATGTVDPSMWHPRNRSDAQRGHLRAERPATRMDRRHVSTSNLDLEVQPPCSRNDSTSALLKRSAPWSSAAGTSRPSCTIARI